MKESNIILESIKWGFLIFLFVGFIQSNIEQDHIIDRLDTIDQSCIKGWGND